ncbi:hypothetical protein DUE52_02205 [Larkinella punicea]|uniref:C4-dicarboxylate ABC transporter n=1 Tax=Larkinella punicea TaxID=2315727 RepID=A0A368JUK6_9BACT|nr:hypothetical protein DUE52_02205 [Larkinella punicea]
MKEKPSADLFSLSVTVLMGLLYLGGGIYLIASSQSFGLLPTGIFRYLLAGLLIIYGLFRAYRGIQRWL